VEFISITYPGDILEDILQPNLSAELVRWTYPKLEDKFRKVG
jgi:hypothetical protein